MDHVHIRIGWNTVDMKVFLSNQTNTPVFKVTIFLWKEMAVTCDLESSDYCDVDINLFYQLYGFDWTELWIVTNIFCVLDFKIRKTYSRYFDVFNWLLIVYKKMNNGFWAEATNSDDWRDMERRCTLQFIGNIW